MRKMHDNQDQQKGDEGPFDKDQLKDMIIRTYYEFYGKFKD